LSTKYQIGDVIEVEVQKIVPRGFGLGFADGLTVMVPLAAPGDRLRVRIVELKKRLAFAEIVEVVATGPERIEPPCPYFGTCGGCDFQHLNYGAQLAAKVSIIDDCLRRIGKIEPASEIKVVASPAEFGYRSRARWHLDRERRAIGYYARNSHDVIDVATCPILTPELESELAKLRQEIRWEGIWADQAEVEATSGDGGEVSRFSNDSAEASRDLTFSSGGFDYKFSAEVFFQANKLLIPSLIDAAIGDLTGAAAFDLYAGVGLFTLPLASKFAAVTAVEGSPKSVRYAKQNVLNAGLDNVKLINDSIAGFLNGNSKRRVDLVLLDPPRSGPEPQTINRIAALRPAQISYVSCEPSILARDLRLLIDAGYTLDSVTAVDLFPQSHHVETVARLVRLVG